MVIENSSLVSVLFREVFSHPYISFYHLLVNVFCVITISGNIIYTYNLLDPIRIGFLFSVISAQIGGEFSDPLPGLVYLDFLVEADMSELLRCSNISLQNYFL